MAADIKGITIEIGGNTQPLLDALEGVNKSLKNTQGALKDVDRLLKLDPGNTDLLKQKQEYLAKAIDDTKEKLDKERIALEQLKNSDGFDPEKAKALERQIAADEQALKRLTDQAKDFGSVAKQQFKAAGEQIEQTGKKIEGAGKAFAPVSAAAGGALAGLTGLGYKAVTTADDLNTLSKQTGISTDELQKFTYASDRIDVSLETVTGSMAKLKKNMVSDSKDTVAAFEQLGVSVRDVSDGSMRQVTNVFDDVILALAEIPNETERDQLAMQLFGRSADQLAGIIDDGGAAFRQYGEEAEQMGLIVSGETLNRLNETNDRIDQVKATVGASLLELGGTVAEALTPVVEKAAGFIDQISEKIRSLTPEQMQLIVTILAVVAAISPVLIIAGKLVTTIGLVVKGIGSVVAVLPALLNPITLVVAAVVGLIAIFKHLYDTNEGFRTKVNEVWAAIQAKIGTVIEAVKGFITAFVELINAIWAEHGDTILAVATTVWNGISAVISTVIDAIVAVITAATKLIKGDWQGAWETIRDFATETLDKIWSVVGEKVTAIKDTIVEKVTEAVNFLRELPGKALDWGKDLIDNFISGITEAAGRLWDTVKDIGEGIADFIGFSEPKKGPLSNFHTFAPDMMKLYAEGIRDNMHLVTDQLNALAGGMSSAAQTASFAITNNVILDGQIITSYVNRQLGEVL